MYRKLEENNEPLQAKEKQPEGECVCTCREPEADPEATNPPVDKAVIALATYYEVNG